MEYAFALLAMTMAPEQSVITGAAAAKAALAAPYSPYMVDGVNLAGVSVTRGVGTGKEPKKCKDDDSDWKVKLVTEKKTHAFTKVGEYHTNWKATGGFTYTTGADTSVSFEVSADAVHFHADHTTTYSNSATDTDSASNGPDNSHLVVISLKYREMARIDYPCKNPGTTTCYPKVICAQHDWVEEAGLYNPGGGWKYIKLGKSVHGADGYSGWLKDGNTACLNAYDAGFGHCVDTGHGISYENGAAVSVELVTVTMSTESDHNTSAEQCIQFQRGKRYNELELNSKGQPKYNGDHMVWGSNALLTAVPGPRVFYSY
jgi:hypothetical protein